MKKCYSIDIMPRKTYKIYYFVILTPIQHIYIYLYVCVYFFPLMVGSKSVDILFPMEVTGSRSTFRFKECGGFVFIFV